MRFRRTVRVFFWGMAALLCLLFVPKLFLSETALYQEILTSTVMRFIASPIKMVLLFGGALLAWASAKTIGRDNPAFWPWLVMGAGVALSGVGQSCLSYYQLLMGIGAPFPSVADPPFVLGTILIALATFMFVVIYFRSGLAFGGVTDIAITVTAAALTLSVVGVIVLRPIAAAEADPIKQLLNLGYPSLDLILLLPTIALTRMFVRMRGGQLSILWLRLLGGFFLIAIGDVLYAYFSTMNYSTLDPLLDLCFAGGYLMIAWGTFTQFELVKE